MINLIFIHGRSQSGTDENELRHYWIGSLARGFNAAGLRLPEDLEIRFPFYADALDQMVRAVSAPVLTNVLLRGGNTLDDAPDSIRMDILREILVARGIPEAQVHSQLNIATSRGLENSQLILAMLRALDSTIGGDTVVNVLTRDVSIYLGMAGVQRYTDEIVSKAISGDCNIVVAHSLGSIVAYNVLIDRSQSLPAIPLLVTLGSPLGIRAISRRLRSGTMMPKGVSRWLNARDPRDVVALRPITFTAGDEARLTNYSSVENRTASHHGIEGYLTDPFVISQLDAAFREQKSLFHERR